MLSPKMQKTLNQQIVNEMHSSYVYLSMAAYFESTNLDGFASWMMAQSQEEVGHAMRIYKYINDRNGRVKLGAIDAPESEWKSPLAAFEDALAHEQLVTGQIHDLVDLAAEEKDRATYAFLQWFVSEQVEEEAVANRIIEQLRLVGDSNNGLFMLNQELGGRTPSTTSTAS